LVGAFAIGKMDIDVTGFGRFRRSVPSRRRAMWWRRVAMNGMRGRVRTGHADGESGHDDCLCAVTGRRLCASLCVPCDQEAKAEGCEKSEILPSAIRRNAGR
jgi:hypothetical protein